MFRKTFLVFSLMLASTVSALSADTLLEAKGAYFSPTDYRFRKIYSGGGQYGAEITHSFWCPNLYLFGSVDNFYKKGSSIGASNDTSITLVPIALGLKYFYPIKCFDVYAGLGIVGTYMHTKDIAEPLRRNTKRWGVGGIAKAGVIYDVGCNIFLDLFTSYTYTEINFHNHGSLVRRHNANLSGWAIGAGIGYRFGCKL